jgi:hypothetical protein
LVDGKELAAGVREVPRPAPRAKVVVTVRAAGFGDETLTITEGDEPTRKVSLQKKNATAPSGGKKKDDGLPQNPY